MAALLALATGCGSGTGEPAGGSTSTAGRPTSHPVKDTSITARPGERFTLTVDQNASTREYWYLVDPAPDSSVLVSRGRDYASDSGDEPVDGAGGRLTFTFEAKGPAGAGGTGDRGGDFAAPQDPGERQGGHAHPGLLGDRHEALDRFEGGVAVDEVGQTAMSAEANRLPPGDGPSGLVLAGEDAAGPHRRSRRTLMMRRSVRVGVRRGLWCGRLERSVMPASPSRR
ncbi:hypothetical protein SCANM63S_10235 [Streptomyces canarius]